VWKEGPELPIGVHGMFPVFDAARSKIYVVGGGVLAAYSQSRHVQVLEMDKSANTPPTPPPTAPPTAPPPVTAQPTDSATGPRHVYEAAVGCCRTASGGNGDIQVDENVAALEGCLALCDADVACLGAEYQQSTGGCESHIEVSVPTYLIGLQFSCPFPAAVR
jgi:hypothetical protein